MEDIMKSNIKIHFDGISLLIPILLLLEERLSHTVALLLAAALHECGHLLAARLFHIPISALHISILGARLELRDPLLSYRREWILCAAGPLSSFFFAAVAMNLASIFPHSAILPAFAMISSALGLVNLLPIGWLDGGRMFRATCHLLLPPQAAFLLLRIVSFFFFLLLWMTSVYLMLRAGNSLTLFAFSFSLFLRFFLAESK